MATFPPAGKIDRAFFDEVIYPRLGAPSEQVLLGPRHGCDNGVVRVGDDRVMLVTTDPLSVIPALGFEDSAWLSVHLLASDLATSALAPQHVSVTLNLPPHMGEAEFERYWQAFHQACSDLGIAVVAGHTGRFLGCDYTIVGGATMTAIGGAEAYVVPDMARPGDRVLLTKGAAIAATGVLARVFPESLRSALGDDLQTQAAAHFDGFSVVQDALTVASAGVRSDGVTAMHDATEGGVMAALSELATAAGCGIEVDASAIPVSEASRRVCELFGLDPYRTLSAGTLLAAVRPGRTRDALAALHQHGIPAAEVGALTDAAEGLRVRDASGTHPLKPDEVDRYWQAFGEAMEKGWS